MFSFLYEIGIQMKDDAESNTIRYVDFKGETIRISLDDRGL